MKRWSLSSNVAGSLPPNGTVYLASVYIGLNLGTIVVTALHERRAGQHYTALVVGKDVTVAI